MKETLDAAFSLLNIIPTTLLILILIYWLTVIVGVFNIDSFDIDTDVDIDADVDVDIDADLDVDADTDVDLNAGDSLIWLNSALSFFNLGKIPLMIILSFFVITMWVISILANYYLNNTSILLSIIYLIPNIVISAFITKFLSTPFVKIFAKAENHIEKNKKLRGKICTVTLAATHDKMGQAVINDSGDTYTINILATEEKFSLQKGDTCLVIDYIAERKIYLIEPYKD